MATIITRETGATAKGSPLTNAELDQNFINLNTASAPAGGSTSQALLKTSNSDFSMAWGDVVTPDATQVLTNKEVVPRVVTIADGTSITVNADATDIASHTNTQAAGTLTINAPSGTAVDGQKFIIRIKSTNAQVFSWNAIFIGSTDLALPSATSGSSKTDYVGFIYNSATTKWHLLAKIFGF